MTKSRKKLRQEIGLLLHGGKIKFDISEMIKRKQKTHDLYRETGSQKIEYILKFYIKN